LLSCSSSNTTQTQVGIPFTISADVSGLFQLEHESRWARNRVAGLHPIWIYASTTATACGEEARITSLLFHRCLGCLLSPDVIRMQAPCCESTKQRAGDQNKSSRNPSQQWLPTCTYLSCSTCGYLKHKTVILAFTASGVCISLAACGRRTNAVYQTNPTKGNLQSDWYLSLTNLFMCNLIAVCFC
jgi:hypothetical protein